MLFSRYIALKFFRPPWPLGQARNPLDEISGFALGITWLHHVTATRGRTTWPHHVAEYCNTSMVPLSTFQPRVKLLGTFFLCNQLAVQWCKSGFSLGGGMNGHSLHFHEFWGMVLKYLRNSIFLRQLLIIDFKCEVKHYYFTTAIT